MQATGAERILALHPDPTYRDLLRRLGFVNYGDFVNVLDMESTSGILKQNIRRRG